MHEETRRRLLRVAFGAFCLLPTLAVVGWSIAAALPLHSDRWEQRLRDRFGWQVSIGDISTPRPGIRRLHDVAVQEIESRRTLVRISQIDATHTPDGWRWQIDRVQLPQSALAELWQIVDRRWLRDDTLAAQLAEIAIEQLELAHPARPITLHELHWQRGPQPQVQRGQLAFRLSDQSADDVVTIDLARDRTGPRATTRLVLDTHGAEIPLSLLASVIGHDLEVGGMLRGRLPVEWRDGGALAQFEGEITGLNLRGLSPGWIPYALDGVATLRVERSTFDAAGLISMQGRLDVKDLAAPAALVQSLLRSKLLSFHPSQAAAEGDDTFAAPEFGVRFSLGERGFECEGVPDAGGLPIAARDTTGPLLLSDAHVRMNSLICALVPEDVQDAYVLRARLMRFLPATLPR